LEQRNQFLSTELDRVTRLLDERTKEVEHWKSQLAEFEHEKQIEIEEVRIQFEGLRRSQVGISDHGIRFAAERSAFETQIMQLRQKLSEFELKITDLTKENQRLNHLYSDKQREFLMISQQYSTERGGNSNELDQARQELEFYRNNNSDSKELRLKFEMEKSSYETTITQLKQALEANKLEISKVLELCSSRKGEADSLQRQLNESRNENSKISKEMKYIETDFMTKGSKYEQLYSEAEELARSRDMYKSQLERNNMEITMRNKELIEKIQEVDALKMKYEEALANVEPMTLTTSKVITRTSYMDRK